MIRKTMFSTLVFIWVIIILTNSSQIAEKSNNQSLKITTFVYNSVSKYSGNSIDISKTNHYIRKIAHVFEYFILVILFLGLFKTIKVSIKYKYWIGLIICEILAIVDEYSQTFVSGRNGNIKDIFIDSVGIVIGLMFILIFDNIRNIKKLRF